MGEKPNNKSLDRVDNNKGYSKENCRWSTRTEQCSNRRDNKYVLVDGNKLTITAACREYGVNHAKMYRKFYQGIPFQKAFDDELKNKRS